MSEHDATQRWAEPAMVHRSMSARPQSAERVEREIASGNDVEVDIDELTDRVYQLFVDQLVRERDRAAWVG